MSNGAAGAGVAGGAAAGAGGASSLPVPWAEREAFEATEEGATPRTAGSLCLVCAAALPTHVLVPCGHRCVCGPCALALCDARASERIDPDSTWTGRAACPVCHEMPMQAVLVVDG